MDKKIKQEECLHIWVEIEQNHNGGDLEILYKCEKCGASSVERYRFVEGYELDKDGKIKNKYI